MLNEPVSAHKVIEELGCIDDMPLSKEKTFLEVSPFHVSEVEANDFRYFARHIAQVRNMPMAFWSNSSGGVHCGFFVLRAAPFKEIKEYLESSKLSSLCEQNFKKVALKLFNYLSEQDPDEKYDVYKF